MPPIGVCAQLACIWEATTRKPGNVHRYRDFADSSYVDFLASAAAVAPILQTANERGVGATVLEAIRATRQVTSTNTNLGILLLLAPLAAVPVEMSLQDGLTLVLERLNLADSIAVYEAIRLAAPAGLGRVDHQDVADQPTQPLREVMALAAERDLIARQYLNGFADVFTDGLGSLQEGLRTTPFLEDAIILCQLTLLARHGDSLIARKRGRQVSDEARRRAGEILQLDWPRTDRAQESLAKFDTWLRADGRGRNPGTTADLVAASLFVALREGMIALPLALPWSAGADHV